MTQISSLSGTSPTYSAANTAENQSVSSAHRHRRHHHENNGDIAGGGGSKGLEKELEQLVKQIAQLLKQLGGAGQSSDDDDDDGDGGGQNASGSQSAPAAGGGQSSPATSGGGQASPAAGGGGQSSPAAGTPAAGTPAAGTPAAGTPAAGTPAAGTPAAGTPGTSSPGTSSTSAGNTGASTGANQAVGTIPPVSQFGAVQANNSPIDAQGNPHLVDPNKPIDIPFNSSTNTYDPRASAFVAQQCASTSGMTLDGAKQLGMTSMGGGGGPAGTDGGTWEMANGPAKGVLYSAAMVGAAAYKGYTSAQDQADVVAWPNVETGATGSTSGNRDFTQAAGTGVAQGGQGPVQITAPYHPTTAANNPAVSAVEAITAGEQTNGGGKQPTVKDAIIPYNSGVAHDTTGQSEGARGSYASYMETVVQELGWITS